MTMIDQPATDTEVETFGLVLPPAELEVLRVLALKRGMSINDAIRRAISLAKFIEDIEDRGAKLLVEDQHRKMHHLRLR